MGIPYSVWLFAINSNNSQIIDLKIKILIDEALRKYDSDKIALADYALESVGKIFVYLMKILKDFLGGSVMVEYSSKTFTDRSPTFNILGLPILKRTITPNVILRVKY